MDTVMITLKSKQISPDGESETMELITVGTSRWEEDVFLLSYEDTEATGFAGATTTIRVAPDQLTTIMRTGSVNSNLVLESKKKHFCLYSTPFGEMTIGVRTRSLEFLPEENGNGTLRAAYTIDLNGALLSEDQIDLYWECQ